ncbi:hypothetical protein DY000_02013194 [Brassica cretica]|uniref:Transmembrane protein n=1 Tax=Brassica cretica TaxID=69181 RepID=A0ABQ7D267_BRACR|nr:hypothetical protein DY000_02013194 [Brassica cretica]
MLWRIRFPPAKERPLDLEVHIIFWCSSEVGEAEQGVKGRVFRICLLLVFCERLSVSGLLTSPRRLGVSRPFSGDMGASQALLPRSSSGSAFNPLLSSVLHLPGFVASALAEDTGSLYRRFSLVSFMFLFHFRLPPVPASGRCRLPPFGSRRRLRVERLVFSLGMWVRSPLQWFPLLNRQSQCRVSSLDWAWRASSLNFLRSVSSLVLVVAAVSGPAFCKNCLSANGFGGDLRVSTELELKRASWAS